MNKGLITKLCIWFPVIALIAAGVVLGFRHFSKSDETAAGSLETAFATRGPMIIPAKEFGQIEAAKRTIISNELEWSVIIKSVVEQGTLVKKGNVIIEFECKNLEDAIDNKEIEVVSAQLSYEQAEKNLQLKKKAVANEISKAENVLKLAQEQLQRYKDKGGQWEMDLNDAESDIQLAKQQLALARDKLSFKEQVNSDKSLKSPYSQNEIEADRLSVKQLELSLKKAEAQKQMLIKYDNPQQLRQLQEEVGQAGIDLERTRLEKEIEVTLQESELKTQKLKLEKIREKLKELKEQKAKLIVKAEQEGLVIYDTGWSRWRSSNVEVGVGEKIGPRQRLMKIPDMTTLEVETIIFEALVSQIHARDKNRKGTEAIIKLDSIPGKEIHGYIKWISPVPRHNGPHWMQTGSKVYELKIDADWEGAGLKPGEDIKPDMNGEVQLILNRLEDVLTIPIESVFSEEDQYYCWKMENGTPVEKKVTIGRMNDDRVQIVEGLEEGDEVLLSFDGSDKTEGKDGDKSVGKKAENETQNNSPDQ
jgi:multidrug efflux pump subunit AcrA (membrane-fusion protein)